MAAIATPATDTELTADLLVGMHAPLDPRVSPDGRLVAYRIVALSKSRKDKKPRAAIWVAPTDSSAPARRWTTGDAHDDAPRWSPDGRVLGFLSDRVAGGKAQIYRLPVEGGEAVPVTAWQGGIERFEWSPDGRHIAFIAADEAIAARREEQQESGDDPEVWGEQLAFHRLRLIGSDGGAVTALTPADRHVTAEAWAPSGREIVVALAPRPDIDAPAEAGVDLVRYPVDGGVATPVGHVPFGAGNLTWTEDGRGILFTAWEAGAIPSAMGVFVVSAQGGTPRCLTTGLDGSVTGLIRPASSSLILCAIAAGLTTRIDALDPVTGGRTPWFAPARGVPEAPFSTDARGRTLSVRISAASEPPEIWCGDPTRALRRVSVANPALAGVPWATQEPLTWHAADGWEIDGLVLRPPGAVGTAAGVVLVHGGPYGRWADGFNGSSSNWAQWLALAGYAVLLPNPRGGMGHGHGFAATVAGEVGMADWRDVATGTDAFIAAGHADRDRIGIGGWSQGGFMTAWAATGGIPEADGSPQVRGWDDDYDAWRSGSIDRFRCGIDGAGPTDWGSMVTESDLATFEAMLGGSRLGDGPGPHRHAVVSPISYANRARTPLLILHGKEDRRVPVGQAIGFFHELRRRNVPVEMVLYPREPHGIGEAAHQRDMLTRVRAWYDRWLLGRMKAQG